MLKKSFQLNPYVFLLTLTVIAFFLRYQSIVDQSYWMDELYSAARSMPNKAFFDVYYWGPDPHPPFHYILLWGAYNIFGFSEFVGRGLSVFAGTLMVPAVYHLGKEIFNRNTGFLAAIAVTFNPVLLYFSIEVRAYEFLSLFSVLSTYLLIKNSLNPKIIISFLYFASLLILINLHFFGFLILIAHLFAYIIFQFKSSNSKEAKFIILPILLSSLSYIPLLGLTLEIAGSGPTWIEPVPMFSFIQNTFSYFIFGATFENLNLLNFLLGNILFIYLMLFFIFAFMEINNYKYMLIFFIFIFIFISSILIGLIINPIFNARNAIGFLPFLIIVLSYGIEVVERKKYKITAISLVTVLFLAPLFFYETASKQEWRQTLLRASELSNKIYVSSWIGQWDVYRKWLGLNEVTLLPFSDIHGKNISHEERIYVVWAQMEPGEFTNLQNIINSLSLEDEIIFHESGIHIYKKIQQRE